MTVLRQRMLDDMRIRNLAAETQTSYLRQVAKFARYHGQSPELLGPEDIRTYQLHLIDERQLAPTSVAGTVAALRFLYQVTLKRDWAVEALPLPKRGDTLPVILSPEEVVRFLDGVARPQAPHDPHHVLRRRAATRRGAAAPGRRCRQCPDGSACRTGEGRS